MAVLSSPLFAQEKIESTPELRLKTFDTVWKTIDEKYFDPSFGGLDWDGVRARYLPRVSETKNDKELYDVLRKMLGELRVSHTQIVEQSALEKTREAPVLIGLCLIEIDGQVVVWRVFNKSSAAESAIRPGFIIKSIDGVPVKNVDEVKAKFLGAAGTKLKVGCLNEKDELQEIEIERRLAAPGILEKESLGNGGYLYALFQTKRVAENIGYIQFTSFITPLRMKLRWAIRSMADAPGIIIDLRGNGGGDDAVGIEMANALFDKKTLLMITRTRKGDDEYYTAKPNKDPYTGKVVILLDHKSASASEQFAAGLQEAGRATIIGNRTEGADMDATLASLPNGAIFLYPFGQPRTPKGAIIEGRGVIPDIEVNLTRKGLLEGRDEQMEAAIEFIKTGNSQ